MPLKWRDSGDGSCVSRTTRSTELRNTEFLLPALPPPLPPPPPPLATSSSAANVSSSTEGSSVSMNGVVPTSILIRGSLIRSRSQRKRGDLNEVFSISKPYKRHTNGHASSLLLCGIVLAL